MSQLPLNPWKFHFSQCIQSIHFFMMNVNLIYVICLTFLLMIPVNILDIHSRNKSLTFILFVLQMKGLHQCFSTGVPRHTSVPWKCFKCAAKSWNILKSIYKQHYLVLFLTLECAPKLQLFPNKCAACKKMLLHFWSQKHFYYIHIWVFFCYIWISNAIGCYLVFISLTL